MFSVDTRGEIVLHRPETVGQVIAHELGNGALRSARDTEAQVAELLEEMRKRDQVSNDIIADFIRECRGWHNYIREGGENLHYCIDTYFMNPDGGATYIMIDYETPKEHGFRDDEERIRAALIDTVPKIDDGPITDEEFADYIVDTSRYARITHFTPEAVEFFKLHATPDTTMVELLGFRYGRDPVLLVDSLTGEQMVWERSEREQEIIEKHITFSTVYLDGVVPSVDAKRLVDDARVSAGETYIEETTHHWEYRQLRNQYVYDNSLSSEERAAMERRLREIMTKNSLPPDEFLYAWHMLMVWDELCSAVRGITSMAWNAEARTALVDNLAGIGIFLESEKAAVRQQVAQIIFERGQDHPSHVLTIGMHALQ